MTEIFLPSYVPSYERAP